MGREGGSRDGDHDGDADHDDDDAIDDDDDAIDDNYGDHTDDGKLMLPGRAGKSNS